jgi:hypothetical protein
VAVFNLTITYPDGEGTRIMTALKAHFGVATNAEAIEAFRKSVARNIKTIVYKQELDEAVVAAAAAVTETSPS